ncbi:MAG: tRNA epoxyqueuosine(34) reductase QueG [Mariprofundaceae bacterium]|nr:tRNA epoxyqueuosine(34) reductase QueG [Mariprofundaceae bacterium]
MNKKSDLCESVRNCAYQHGFDLCHFSRPKITSKDCKALDHWLASNMHADMAWMAEENRLERRKDPSSMMNDVQTIISLAMRHTPPPYNLEEACSSTSQGIIASYAHGVDYHDIMKKRLKALARDLDVLLGEHEQRVYVDTAPILEHALAASSGLGWQGKHTLTIHRQYGSWMMLGELFTSAKIPIDQTASEHCGSCTACLDICPTKAIVAPYVVDANLCISYLTIEYKGFIPHKLRALMGNHIYGCDDCQAICPWNNKAEIPDTDLLTPRGENILPELAMLLHLDEQGFRERFRKSPVKRTGRAAFLRNICIAMGNSGNIRFAPLLLEAIYDVEPLIRGHAIWALSVLHTLQVIDGFIEKMLELKENEKNNHVLKEIDMVLD